MNSNIVIGLVLLAAANISLAVGFIQQSVWLVGGSVVLFVVAWFIAKRTKGGPA